jgi:hypothetical protein
MSDNPSVANSPTQIGTPTLIPVRGDADAAGKIRQVVRLDFATGTSESLVSEFNQLPVLATLNSASGSSVSYNQGTADDGTLRVVTASDSQIAIKCPSTGTLANKASSATSITLIASNASRLGFTIHNDSTAILYVKFGGTASSTSYSVKLIADAYYESPIGWYTGVIDGIWASATGSARVTELT